VGGIGQGCDTDGGIGGGFVGGGTPGIIMAASGTYSITGQDVELRSNRILNAEAGSYSYTGTEVGLLYPYTLVADAGSYSITGTAAGLGSGLRMDAEAGAYTITGSVAMLARGYVLSAEAGAYAITGTAAGLLANRAIAAASGVYNLTGTAATLDYYAFDWADYANIRQLHDFTVSDEMLSDGAMTVDTNEAYWDSFAVKSGVPISITGSYKTSNTTNTNIIAAVSDIDSAQDYLYIAAFGNTDTRAVFKGSGTSTVCVGDGNTADGANHFIGAAATSSNLRCWVDGNAGVDESHSQTPAAFDLTSLGVLRISGLNFGFFTGTVDNVAFWNRVITDDEYTWLYNSNTPRTFKEITESGDTDNPGVSALAAYYALNEWAVLDKIDATVNGNDLTEVIGSPGATFGLSGQQEYTQHGSFVKTIQNLQGNGGELVQDTLLNRPSWQTIGGDDVLHFPGTNDNMLATPTGGDSAQPNTIFIVCKIEDKGADQKLFDGLGPTVEHAIGVDDGNTVMTMSAGSLQEMTLTPDYGNIHVWCGIFDGASSRLYKDGGTADVAPASIGAEQWGGVVMGAQYNVVLLNAKAEHYYYMFNDGEMNATEINQIGNYLAAQVGTSYSDIT
jgi:hypothetical protein